MLAYAEGSIVLWTLLQKYKFKLDGSKKIPVCKVILAPDKAVMAKVIKR